MFRIGDKIAYPMHGTDTITEVQDREVLGVKKDYFILKMLMGEMKIPIPVDKINDMGIRFVVEEEIIHSLRDILKNQEIDFPSNWNQRYKKNLGKLRIGDIKETAIVYKGLHELDPSRGLSMIEKKVLNTFGKMLTSEIASGLNLRPSEAESMMNDSIDLDQNILERRNVLLRQGMSILISIIEAVLGTIFINVIFNNLIEKSTSMIIKIVAMTAAAAVFGSIFYALVSKLISIELKLIGPIEDSLKKFSLVDIITGTIGLVVGPVLTFLISQPLLKLNISGIGTVLTVILKIMFFIGVDFLGAKLALSYHDDFISFFEKVRTKEKSNLKFSNKDSKVRPKIVDTSTIIDGRTIDILRTGFLEGSLIIPIFVIEESQYIADSDNYLRRQKGRRGLDIPRAMQTEYKDKVRVVDKRYPNIDKVDSMFVKMSEELNANLLTNDYNLNKVAGLQEVFVFNVNDLANAMRPVLVAGEPISVSIIKEGRENNQGVGYLDDGTMIVVEDGKKYLGEITEYTVTSVLQTSAGKMIFAKKSGEEDN